MQHIKELQNVPVVQMIRTHPNRDLILVGLGAATLLGIYTCYRCCCSRKQRAKVEAKPASNTHKSANMGRASLYGSYEFPKMDAEVIPTVLAAAVEETPRESQEPQPQPQPQAPAQADRKSGEPLATTICPPCEKYLTSCGCGGQSKSVRPAAQEEARPSTKSIIASPLRQSDAASGEKSQRASDSRKSRASAGTTQAEEEEAKASNDGNKYLPTIIRSPPGLVCPPARVGISLFMDTRPVLTDRLVSASVMGYRRDRWYRGSWFRPPPASAAFLRASQYPVPRRVRPGKMLRSQQW